MFIIHFFIKLQIFMYNSFCSRYKLRKLKKETTAAAMIAAFFQIRGVILKCKIVIKLDVLSYFHSKKKKQIIGAVTIIHLLKLQ